MSPTRWTPDRMPSLTGRTAVVTGANSGIGRHTAAELARHGAAVTLACRDVGAGERAADAIRAEGALDGALDGAAGEVGVAGLDLSSQASVARFADRWRGPLDLLVNNAGVMTPPRHRSTEDGHELQLGTNHLGHFALTGRLLPSLLAAREPRVVTVSSVAHHQGGPAVLEGNPPRGYRPQPAYGNSKLANLLFALELQRRATAHGTTITSTAAHPGVSATGLVTDEQGLGSLPLVSRVAPLFLRLFLQSARDGAQPTLYAATHAEPGSYTGPQSLRETRGAVGPARLSAHARDEELAERLWQQSEELTGVAFAWD